MTVIYVGLFGRTKKSCDKNLIAQRIIKFCAKLNSKRQASYKSLQAYGIVSFPRQHRVALQNALRIYMYVAIWQADRIVELCLYVISIMLCTFFTDENGLHTHTSEAAHIWHIHCSL